MLPLIRERLQARAGAARETSIDAHARKLVTLDGSQSKSFAEFAAFDLALDEQALDTLVRIRQGIATTDVSSDQLACLWNLVRLEANPEVVQRFMLRVVPAIGRLDAEGRWPYFAFWLSRFGELAAALRETRPDVSDVIVTSLAEFSTVDRARRIVDLAGRGAEGRAAADTIILALGSGIGPALAAAASARRGRTRGVSARRPATPVRPRRARRAICRHRADHRGRNRRESAGARARDRRRRLRSADRQPSSRAATSRPSAKHSAAWRGSARRGRRVCVRQRRQPVNTVVVRRRSRNTVALSGRRGATSGPRAAVSA